MGDRSKIELVSQSDKFDLAHRYIPTLEQIIEQIIEQIMDDEEGKKVARSNGG